MRSPFPRALPSVASLLAQATLLARRRLGRHGDRGWLLAELSAAREICRRLRGETRLLRGRLALRVLDWSG